MRPRWPVLTLVAVASFLCGGWLLQRGAAADAGGYRQARLFDDIVGRVEQAYVDPVPDSVLYQKAADGLLEELHDPYTVLLRGQDYRDLQEETSGNYAGLGIRIDVRNGWITVVAPLPDSPAERAGIETGDQLVSVDGRSAESWQSDAAVRRLRGPPGSKVKIGIR
ncbi:MAG TPA: PDZ domain-containing protein, partial [Gemmatimonadales bacterium]|nr:PDZ domain-containing protein [Gemmatimonadales bacterium]